MSGGMGGFQSICTALGFLGRRLFSCPLVMPFVSLALALVSNVN